ncbi:putative disease resistance protein [Senna tora]|uniref:Putative disease resistance protein n=1 Tax=Senna tora TaxID=362788 RepID=A0A834X998_9FABA|nr:putative disease resistance protein [Senna tora]
MVELLCALAGKVLELTVEPIGRHLGYLISYHSNVTKLKHEFHELQNEREAVQHRVDDAQRQGEDIEAKVQDWFTQVNEITELVDKFYEKETHANTDCSFKSCPNLWLRHQISRKANKMTLEVAEIKEKAKFDKVSFYKPPELLELQSIILLSAMLSHDPLIIDLLMYSVGLSLLQDVHSMKDAQDALDFLVSKLKASSLLLDSFSNNRFTMHDVFREFSLSIASKEQHGLVVSFPMLETLDLKRINTLITSIWDDHLPHNSFGNLKTLIAKNCGFLVKLVPLHVLISLSNLEELEVTRCGSLEMVFDFNDLNNYKKTKGSWIVPLKKIRLRKLPKLMHVWSNDPQEIFSFQGLRQVTADNCKRLASMFPASIAKGMLHLEELEIRNCGMDVIVAKAQVLAPTFVFPKLNKLELEKLPNLKNLYGDRHTSEWPCLQHLTIYECDGLEIFQKRDSSLSSSREESSYVKYPLLFHEKVIPNLKKLTISGKQLAAILSNDQLGFPRTLLNLKELALYVSSKEIFSVPLKNDFFHILPNLECLDVSECGDFIKLRPSFISLENLTNINVSFCSRLTSLLASSTVTSLAQLTMLTISWCFEIEEIIAKDEDDDVKNEIINFKKLRFLKLEELPKLKCFCSDNYTLMFPSLDRVIIRGCGRLSMFCPGDIHTPLLKGVGSGYETKELWETNLNKTILLLLTDKATDLKLYPEMRKLWVEKLPHPKPFSKLRSLTVDNCEFLCEYVIPAHLVKCLCNLEWLRVIPRLEGLTLNQKDATMLRDGQFEADLFDKVKTLCLESFVDESLSFPYSFLHRFPYLQQLRVEHCCFEEILPSQQQIASFKQLYVRYLDQLKTIWNDDSQLQPIHQDLERLDVKCCCSLIKLTPSFASLENLTYLKVSGCHQLIYLVTSSTAKSLVKLYTLMISDCERMEEIVRNNESEDNVETTITFNKLWLLELSGLTSLKSFCSQNDHTFEFPDLDNVRISGCDQMKMFCGGVVETPVLSDVQIDEDEQSLKEDLNKIIELLLSQKDATNMYKQD